MLSENQSISQSEINLPCVNVEKDIMLIHTLDTGQFCLSGLGFPESTGRHFGNNFREHNKYIQADT